MSIPIGEFSGSLIFAKTKGKPQLQPNSFRERENLTMPYVHIGPKQEQLDNSETAIGLAIYYQLLDDALACENNITENGCIANKKDILSCCQTLVQDRREENKSRHEEYKEPPLNF